jgi:hypothetical protein
MYNTYMYMYMYMCPPGSASVYSSISICTVYKTWCIGNLCKPPDMTKRILIFDTYWPSAVWLSLSMMYTVSQCRRCYTCRYKYKYILWVQEVHITQPYNVDNTLTGFKCTWCQRSKCSLAPSLSYDAVLCACYGSCVSMPFANLTSGLVM